MCRCVREFVSLRKFEVSWDRAVRGVGSSSVGVPQGSPLSPVLFLVWLAPILVEMERRIWEEVPRVGVEFPSYVDDLHCGLYDERASCRRLEEVERREGMGDLVDRLSVVLKEVAAKHSLPLTEDKEERLILRGGWWSQEKKGSVRKDEVAGGDLGRGPGFQPH